MEIPSEWSSELCSIEIVPEMRAEYIKIVLERCPDIDPKSIEFMSDGKNIFFKSRKRKKILTKMGGTLIGDPETWNDAKRAEYYDTIPNPVE